jgi:hypothetical protein
MQHSRNCTKITKGRNGTGGHWLVNARNRRSRSSVLQYFYNELVNKAPEKNNGGQELWKYEHAFEMAKRDLELRTYAIADPQRWKPDMRRPGVRKVAGVPEIYYCAKWMQEREKERKQAGVPVGNAEIIEKIGEVKNEIKKEILENRKEILDNREVLQKAIKTAVHSIFEFHKTPTPRTFVILPHKLEDGCVKPEQVGTTVDFLKGVMSMVGEAAGFEGKVDEKSNKPSVKKWVKSCFKKFLPVETEMYLYLIDEKTGAPVEISDPEMKKTYPIIIKISEANPESKETVQKLIPLMGLGISALQAFSRVGKIAHCFGVPLPVPDQGHVDTVKVVFDKIEENWTGSTSVQGYNCLQSVLDDEDENQQKLAGSSLKAFSIFLEEHDKGCVWDNLLECLPDGESVVWTARQKNANADAINKSKLQKTEASPSPPSPLHSVHHPLVLHISSSSPYPYPHHHH